MANESVTIVQSPNSVTVTQSKNTTAAASSNPAASFGAGGSINGSLNISQNLDVDGSLETDALTIDGVSLLETIQDAVGGMVTGNTETGITVNYQDSDGTLDFAVTSVTDENFTTADHAKLDAIEALADVTDTANVVSSLTAGTNITIASDGTISSADTQVTTEQIQDAVGSMLSGNTESGITVTYDDFSNEIDFTVASQTDENFTTADHTKLDGIATGADVTPSWVPSSDPTYATESYVSTQVANLVDSAPDDLNTLNELAEALGDDDNFATTVTNNIATKLPLAGGTMTGNIAMSGTETVDGRDLSVDGAKLDNIEDNATADQTAAEIRTLVESATDSNVFTDADHSKLNAIEASADVTDTANVVAALTAGSNVTIAADGTVSSSFTDTTYTAGNGLTLTGTEFTHTDTSSQASSSNSGRTYIQSINVDGFGHITGLTTGTETVVNTDTNTQLSDEQVQDIVGAMLSGNTVSGITITYQDTDGTIDFSVASQTDENFTTADHSKLDGIEASADVTDTDNVVASLTAGTNVTIAADGTVSSSFTDTDTTYTAGNGLTLTGTEFTHTDTSSQASSSNSGRTYIQSINVDGFGHITGLTTGTETVVNTDTNTQLSDEQVQDIVGAMLSGNTVSGITITYQDTDGTIDFSVASQTDENFTTADHSKLDGIEAGATADQTAAEIRTLVESATDSNVFTDADHSKLNNIEASADVTDTANVVAALTAGSNVTIAADGTVSSSFTDTDTTYTAGNGLTLTGTEFTHTDTSSQASSSNSGRTYIQSINVDGFGHITGLTTGTETVVNTDTNTQLSDEQVQDIVGAMLSGNTVSGITITYQDTDGTIDFSVASQTDENFTTADHTKLDGIATGADVTPSWVPSSDPSYATQSYVGTQISNLVDSAPATLDTLNELAAALGDDANFSTTISNSIGTKLALAGGTMSGDINMGTNNITNVGNVDGRDVSADGTKLDGIEASADVTDTANVVAALTAGSNVTIAADGTVSSSFTDTDTTYTAGNGLTLTGTEFTHTDTSTQASSSNSGRTYIQSINVDGFGHITGLTTGTETVVNTDTNTQLSDEQVQDIVGAMVSSNTESGIAVTYDDTNGKLNLTVASQTDQNFTTADHSKLDGIEAGATADQTAAEIRTLVESATDSNVFTDADHSKLNAIEASADVTDTANVVAALTAGSNVTIAADGTVSSSFTDTDTTYTAGSGLTLSGTTFSHSDTSSQSSSANTGRTYIQSINLDGQGHVTGLSTATETVVNTDTNTQLSDEQVQDIVGAMVSSNTESGIAVTYDDTGGKLNLTVASQTDQNFTNADHSKLDGIESGATADQTAAEIRALVESATDSNVFTDADHSKLNAIEASADVTDTTNVVAALTAGSNVTIAADGTISSSFTNTNTQLSDEQVQDIVGAMVSSNTESGIAVTYDDTSGKLNLTVASQTDQNFTNADHSKLDGIESGATADQTAAEIRALVESATDSNVFTDADHSKLNGIAAGAEVNVQSNWNATSGDAFIQNKPTIPSGNQIIDWTTSQGSTQIHADNVSTALTGYATQSYVGTQISNLVDSSPAALNTLNELAAALGDDANFSTTVTNSIATKAPLASPSFTGDVVITDDTFPFIRSVSNGAGAGIKFSDQTTYGQQGTLTFRHSDTASYGSGASFEFATTESTCTILGGKLMYGEGIYSKPATGTGAGTRKDTNWDTAYGWGNHASAGYVTSNTQLSTEQVQDAVGAMLSGNTESGITVTYDDTNNQIDFTVASQTDQNFTNADHTKLNGIEASADVTDTTNVVAALTAGSNVTIAADGTISSSFTNTQLSTEQVQDIVGGMVSSNTESGIAVTYDDTNGKLNLTVASQTDQNFTNADHTKLNGIETGATADQTAAEIRTLVESASDSNVFTDADHSKLNGIAAGAEVNVQSNWNATSGDALILNKPTIPSGNQIIDWTSSQGSTQIHADNVSSAISAATAAPAAPTNVSATIVGDTIDITFTASTTSNIDSYFIYSSVDGSDYGLISVVPPDDFSSTMSVIDNSFTETGTQAYRVYAMKLGNMSSAGTASVSYTVSSLEPTNMSVVNLHCAYLVQWDAPSSNSRFVSAYNVYKHEHATQGSLSRASASLVYSGTNTNFMYQISGSNNNNFHQFWVETTIA